MIAFVSNMVAINTKRVQSRYDLYYQKLFRLIEPECFSYNVINLFQLNYSMEVFDDTLKVPIIKLITYSHMFVYHCKRTASFFSVLINNLIDAQFPMFSYG